MASYIGQIKIGANGEETPIGSMLYGICDSTINANNAQKIATLEAFDTLATGVTVHIKFINGNTAVSPTLKVGTTTAKNIVNPNGSLVWAENTIISFTYDGTNWVVNDGKENQYSIISEEDITNSAHTLGELISGQRFNQALSSRIDTAIGQNSIDTQIPSARAVYNYINEKTANITGVMKFKGEVSILPDATNNSTYNTYESGDVILVDQKEYVYNKKSTASESEWIELGDESSYALKSSVATMGSASAWNSGSVPTLGNSFTVPNIINVGAAASFSVQNGTLTLNTGTAPTLGEDFSIPNITSVGTAPSLTITNQTVVIP